MLKGLREVTCLVCDKIFQVSGTLKPEMCVCDPESCGDPDPRRLDDPVGRLQVRDVEAVAREKAQDRRAAALATLN